MAAWKAFLFLTVACLIVQAFFSMMEMACVSFNKVRLQYYVSKNSRRALWLSKLLNRPSFLFGTTLIGVNIALQLGSEASRQFYLALGLSPDWAPISQIIIVLIFAELAPMFAGRRYAESVVRIGIPLLYGSSVVLKPIIIFFDWISLGMNKLLGMKGGSGFSLTREELQSILEEKEEEGLSEERAELSRIVSNIFTLKSKKAKDLMESLNVASLVSASCTVGQMRDFLSLRFRPYLPIYHREKRNVIAIAYPRDLLRLADNKRIQDHARRPWFISETAPIFKILEQFKRNNQSVAIVLDESGYASGILTLDDILDEIFGLSDNWVAFRDLVPRKVKSHLDRSFSGDSKISDINQQFNVDLKGDGATTLEELLFFKLGHKPGKDEHIHMGRYEIRVEEAPLIGPLLISVKTTS